MAVSPSIVRKRLKVLLDSISGVRRAFRYMPRSIEEADCPCFLVVMAEAPLSSAFNTGQEVLRHWRLILLIARAGAGAYGNLEATLDPFFERVEDLFAANLMLNELDSELISARLAEDSGPGLIEFPLGSGQAWFGCEWALIVETKRVVTVGL